MSTSRIIIPYHGYVAFLHGLVRQLQSPRRDSDSSGLLVVQLSNLNRINAAAGYRTGHRLRIEFSAALNSMLRENDWMTALGEDRFAVVFDTIRNAGHLVLAANRIARIANGLRVSDDMSLQLEVRTGAAVFPEHGKTAEQLLRNAELALENAALQKSMFAVFAAAESKQLTENWNIEAEIAAGLENNEFEVVYQPKVDARTLQPCGAEALMRWHSSRLGDVSTERFIQIMEQTDHIDALTNLALHAAARDACEWPASSNGLTIAVNLAASLIEERNIVTQFRHIAAIWGVPVERFTAEVTENGIISTAGAALEVLEELRDNGIRVSIDDFGTGNSSLAYFKDIPADEVKIDKSFVQAMRENEGDYRLVKTIIDLAHSFDMRVVAEGVENAACVTQLQELGCDVLQGYYFSPPLRQEQFIDYLETPADSATAAQSGCRRG